jgi:hypothetical protein
MRKTRLGTVGIVVGLAALGSAAGSPGPAINRCTPDLILCMADAEQLPTVFARSVAGFDCGLEYTACAVRAGIGY